jgi:hypothetical protein
LEACRGLLADTAVTVGHHVAGAVSLPCDQQVYGVGREGISSDRGARWGGILWLIASQPSQYVVKLLSIVCPILALHNMPLAVAYLIRNA